MGCAPCSALTAPEPISEVKQSHLLHQNFRVIFLAASCTASWVGQALSSVKSAGKPPSDICQQQAKNTIKWATALPCHRAQEQWTSQCQKLLLILCCRGAYAGDVQWSLTIFMVCEMFPVTTLGQQPSPTGSEQMYKNKLIFKLLCPNSAATSRAAALLDESLPRQDMEIIAWGKGFLHGTMALVITKCQKGFSSMDNNRFYANVLWIIYL